ncbi:hypothetical protein SDC9_137508 [bioreactor metagenome]|uniref:Uncharacterized protein n=1 Tax=bioreactor metagenome TaxID=1076179 RepID=A0A645DM74_9ZZZZ
MLHIGPGVRGLSHTESPAHPAVVRFVGGPPFFVAEHLKTVVGFGVVHGCADASAAGDGHGVQRDVDVFAHQAAVGETSPYAVDESDEGIGVLEAFASPSEDLRIDTGTDDIVEVMIHVHQFFHVAEHLGNFFQASFADKEGTAVFQLNRGAGPGFEFQGRALKHGFNFAYIDLQGLNRCFFRKIYFHS